MDTKEFKKLAKELAVKLGFKKSDISITCDAWIKIRVFCSDFILFSNLKVELEQLAGYKNNSDITTDYFDYDVDVLNKSGGRFMGLSILKSSKI